MTHKRRLSTAGYYIIGILIAVISLIPFAWMISTSLKARGALMSIPIEWIPKEPTLAAYEKVLTKFPFLKTVANSLFISVSYTIITLISASMAAFAFAKIRFPKAELLLKVFLATMMIPTQVTIIPLFVVMNKLGLINTYGSVLLPSIFRPFAVFLLVQQMRTIPNDYLDAASIDGASTFTVYRKVALPLCAPTLATLSITTFMESWNDYSRDYEQSYRRFLGESRILFSRAGFTGQHTVPLHWAGDQQSQNSELKSALRAGLSAAASGILFWGFDLAGFAGPLPTPDLYRRATQMACFCPVMQWHSEPDGGQFKELMPGGEGNNERSPWNMAAAYNAPAFMEEMRFWYRLREKLRPYICQTAQKSVEESRPLMRPLVYEWPDDPNAIDCEDEYLFGDALLVAPLLEENAEDRTVYLPDGQWIDFFTRKKYDGRRSIRAGGNGKLPVFVRAGCEALLKINLYD